MGERSGVGNQGEASSVHAEKEAVKTHADTNHRKRDYTAANPSQEDSYSNGKIFQSDCTTSIEKSLLAKRLKAGDYPGGHRRSKNGD